MSSDGQSVSVIVQEEEDKGSSSQNECHPLLNIVPTSPCVTLNQIINAVYTGNIEQLKYLLQNATPQTIFMQEVEFGYTALHYTTFSGPNLDEKKRFDLAEILLKREEQINKESTYKSEKSLLEIQDSIGNTPLHHAAEYKRINLVHLFLNYMADPKTKRNDGKIPLHLLSDGKCESSFKCFKRLHRKGISTELQYEFGQIAALAGAELILKFLIDKGHINLERQDTQGLTIAHWCIIGNQLTGIFLEQLLLKVGNQFTGNKNPPEDTLLHIAARVSNVTALNELVKIGFSNISNIDQKNTNRETPFHSAVQGTTEKKAIETFVLLKLGWQKIKLPRDQHDDLMAKDANGRTIFSILCEKKVPNFVEEILSTKFDGLPYPWFSMETLSLLYEHYPNILSKLFNTQINVNPSPDGSSTNVLHADLSLIIRYTSDLKKPSFHDSTALYSCLYGKEKKERNKILTRPLIKFYLQQKWERFKFLAHSWIFLQLVLAFCYNSVAISLYGQVSNSTRVDEDEAIKISTGSSFTFGFSLVLFALALISLIKEVAQYSSYKVKWLYLIYPLNVFQIISNILNILVAIDGLGIREDFGNHVHFVAYGSFLCVFLLIRDFGKLPGFERLYEVLIMVIRNSLKVLFFYLPCLLAFTCAFRILIKRNEGFQLPEGFAKIFSMAIGELDYETISSAQLNADSTLDGYLLQIMYLIFAFLAAIILINLLIAFAVSDIQELLYEAEESRLASQLRLIHDYEHFFRSVAQINNKAKCWIEKKFFLDDVVHTEKITPKRRHCLKDILTEISDINNS